MEEMSKLKILSKEGHIRWDFQEGPFEEVRLKEWEETYHGELREDNSGKSR